LNLLKSVGVDRISLGVQSFVREDLISLKRPQPLDELDRSCRLIASEEFPVFNIDLIYGNEGQDVDRWLKSVNAALAWNPEELYLYPLYVGRLTNLNRSGKRPAEHRRELYLKARDLLRAFGYRQISMRLFRRGDVTRETDYCCQDDGMVGLGPGARSYTSSLHYSSEYAVGQPGILDIIERFNSRTDSERSAADYGAFLDIPEQKRRFVIKSLLRADGVSHTAYQDRFGSTIPEDFPALTELLELDLAVNSTSSLRLTDNGLSWSDTIGPWLYSEAVTSRMGSYELA
jgi:oxygen-independent coproporphyrinogen-3 oxidase